MPGWCGISHRPSESDSAKAAAPPAVPTLAKDLYLVPS